MYFISFSLVVFNNPTHQFKIVDSKHLNMMSPFSLDSKEVLSKPIIWVM